jgi:hypothetical protein
MYWHFQLYLSGKSSNFSNNTRWSSIAKDLDLVKCRLNHHFNGNAGAECNVCGNWCCVQVFRLSLNLLSRVRKVFLLCGSVLGKWNRHSIQCGVYISTRKISSFVCLHLDPETSSPFSKLRSFKELDNYLLFQSFWASLQLIIILLREGSNGIVVLFRWTSNHTKTPSQQFFLRRTPTQHIRSHFYKRYTSFEL